MVLKVAADGGGGAPAVPWALLMTGVPSGAACGLS